MHASENAAQGLTWEGKSVDLEDIERELNRLWEQTTATAQGKSPRVRSSVLNLVVYTSSDADAEKLFETVGRLSGRHPSRAIILSAEPHHEQPSLDTAINSYCFEDPGSGAQVCCEQVLIGANGEPANHLRSIVTPLLLPDLPMYLWWMGRPDYDADTFVDLIGSTDKLVIDSSSFAPTGEDLRRALTIQRERNRVCAVQDLNWIRLWRWFEAIAQFFDDAALRQQLAGIQRLRVEYARGQDGASPAQAALLAGWLYSRLGQQPGDVELRAVSAESVLPGAVVSFDLDTLHEGKAAGFHVRLKDDDSSHADAYAQVGEQRLSSRSCLITPRTEHEALDHALEGCNRDTPYEESLPIAADLLEREAVQ
ncbi:MAG: glucose-6-phosphate dehydrogenase assembly protein OpcA [Chloroflexia bacterium]|nr:glucose-6-phosphate dehydrogenase assembly protein OpcA [Chloroflexia bacterium]